MLSSPATSIDASLELPEGNCVLTHQPLNVEEITGLVGNDAAGAAVVFIGTTRNSFKGNVVTRLEYQAYSKMAIKTIGHIVREAVSHGSRSEHHIPTQQVSAILRCSVYHRLGTVPVGEPSIVIAVSSPHRKEAFGACEFILEEIKRKAQIWKREYYEGKDDSQAEWKENS
ncbi:molybdenum cofactor synthesis 2 [Athelia psychrophila]|uniref:Molybdenum cofactor synthesis 2 n=1 Tax=Athelia psychrophila TaxID=1759441 RepID=A0A165ZGJ3_9AGAM|nr:molybdenum cofactor synthesis 2 [Fibularhizoctonia sp. CBS 109695]